MTARTTAALLPNGKLMVKMHFLEQLCLPYLTAAQKPPSTLESSLTHNSMMTCRPQAHSGNACAPQADTRGHERRTTIWGGRRGHASDLDR